MNVSPVNARGESLPFKEQLFDAACLFDVLEHVQSPEKVLNELFRVLKPGGSVMVTVINKYAFRDPHYHMRFINWMPKGIAEWYIKWRKREKDITICEDRQKLSDMNYFTFEEFRRVAKTTGFKLEDVSFLKINQPHLIRDGKLQKSAEVLKALGLNGLAYFSFRLLSHLCANNFEFILHKRLPRT
jgi:SAM-dependent methyltransferase